MPFLRLLAQRSFIGVLTGVALASCVALAEAQTQPKKPPMPRPYGATPAPTAPTRMERLDDAHVRVGAVTVDLGRKEISVPGTVNDVPAFEFVVNTKDGYKSYESALEAGTNAIDFNLGLILIGLDRRRATVRPRFHFDPIPPAGDPVEIWVSWKASTGERRVRVDELLFDDGTKAQVPASRWVYTGSQFLPNSTAFLADRDGVLIGFAHTPASVIERVDNVPGPYGAIRLNPALGLPPGSQVTITVKSLLPARD